MSNTHTPGKWNWHTSNSWRRLYSEQEHGKQVPVLVPTINPRDGHPELDVSEADMRLIAAAPELYACLEKCAVALGSLLAEETGSIPSNSLAAEWYWEAQKLFERIEGLDKAEGR
jgi:hypothetical protein